MVGKISSSKMERDEGLKRTDNNMEFTAWPSVENINQKNYYTEFLKRDDQILALRLQQEERLNARKKKAVDIDRARAQAAQDGVDFEEPDQDLEDEVAMDDGGSDYGSKTIVIHVGSQNLRIGLATDALPKTVPMVIAKKSANSEAEDNEPRPKRIKLDADASSEERFGEAFAQEYNIMAEDFKRFRRGNKRRVLPNSRELVTKWNSTNPPDKIPEHSDDSRIDWTELPADPAQAPDYIVGHAAMRIPEKSNPRYQLHWPIRHGWLNEKDYHNRSMVESDFFRILEENIKIELGLTHKKDWNQYGCVFIIPDLYEKVVVARILDEFIREFGFHRVCFMQESLAGTFGAGYGAACMVDMGAQKTSISCVEDGMVVEESRMNLKYGGYDVTEVFAKMMLFDKFNYADFNLMRRHDFLLAEELKEAYTTMSDENISVQLYSFFLRVFGEATRKYEFKLYDEGMLAPLGYFRPTIFDLSEKLAGRHRLIPQSVDLYNGHPNDPMSPAQLAVVAFVNQAIPSAVLPAPSKPARPIATPAVSTPIKPQRPPGIPAHVNGGDTAKDATPLSSPAGSPPPPPSQPGEDVSMTAGTPHPADQTDAPNPDDFPSNTLQANQPDTEILDRTIPIMPLEQAILTSIHHGSAGDERRRREFMGSIMLVGGASKTPHLGQYLEMRLRGAMPQYPKDILVAPPPRDLDPSVLVWKGGSVFGKLRMTNDSWIGRLEYDRLGARILNYKCMWHW
ncbi:chromatin remodeling complex subunit [Hortaea werneckii]|nr:chromatin remodeling complex subunit [Hortaea werneckii]KAI6986360.1 chromatin remodeling complex subunit [Hortaea werneckii]KAI7140506.1 chromatin remodeling complex subunit [Hortaea werneckii]KAI7167633.1 chromatin remodeling complex subunit [Hortaea werneckii]KAI7182796.1 chromatin remodeling complex subunit [Hortaea werneckii]